MILRNKEKLKMWSVKRFLQISVASLCVCGASGAPAANSSTDNGIFDAENFIAVCGDIDASAAKLEGQHNQEAAAVSVALLNCVVFVRSMAETMSMAEQYTVGGHRVCVPPNLQTAAVISRAKEIAQEQPELVSKGAPTSVLVAASIATLSPCSR